MATLLIVPAVFSVVIGPSKARSLSVHPDDPESGHYDPVPADHHGAGSSHGHASHEAVPAVSSSS